RRGLPVSSMQKNYVDVGRDAARERACSTRSSRKPAGGVAARNPQSRAGPAVAQCGRHPIRYEEVRFFFGRHCGLLGRQISLDAAAARYLRKPESIAFFVVAGASAPTLSENNRRTNHAASTAESRASTASRHLFATVR